MGAGRMGMLEKLPGLAILNASFKSSFVSICLFVKANLQKSIFIKANSSARDWCMLIIDVVVNLWLSSPTELLICAIIGSIDDH